MATNAACVVCQRFRLAEQLGMRTEKIEWDEVTSKTIEVSYCLDKPACVSGSLIVLEKRCRKEARNRP